MEIYKNKKEIGLYQALKIIACDSVPGHYHEFLISAQGMNLVAFGKSWTKKDTENWGVNTPAYWIHEDYCPTIPYFEKDEDKFVIKIAEICRKMKMCPDFHIWVQVKE